MVNKTDIIAFFSANGFFKLKNVEKQTERFNSSREEFASEFDTELSDDTLQTLFDYVAEQKAAKIEREKRKLERDTKKAAKEALKPLSAGQDTATQHITQFPKGRYVLTCAQNNTDIDGAFFGALLTYCRENNCKLLIAKTTYNKSGFAQPSVDAQENNDLWYAPELSDFIVQGQIDLGGVHFIADANVIPTAKWPTSGFDGVTPGGIGAVIPATKIELRVGAALKGQPNKIIAATGTVTKRNYILRKAGAVAAIGHSIGALFVDTETNELRHLEQVEGFEGFYDLNALYTETGVEFVPAIEALQFGDIHAEKMDKQNLERALRLIRDYEPANIVLHDVLDFSSRNHHNIKDPVFMHVQTVQGNTVAGDLKALATVLDHIAAHAKEYGGTVHIIESNHDLAINTWLKNSDFKIDPVNALTYLTCMQALYLHNEKGRKADYFNMLAFAYANIGKGKHGDEINFHETDESLLIAGIEMGNHGHNGPNGSRGNPKAFAALGVPMNTGHTHSPSIYGSCYTAGVTASLEMGYNIGPSSWAIADVVTYENGQRQIWFA